MRRLSMHCDETLAALKFNGASGNALQVMIDEMERRAHAYHCLARLARDLVQDLSIAATAEDAARAYESAMFEKAKWHARSVALASGHSHVAESILYGVEIGEQPHWPNELREAIRRWRTLMRFRAPNEISV